MKTYQAGLRHAAFAKLAKAGCVLAICSAACLLASPRASAASKAARMVQSGITPETTYGTPAIRQCNGIIYVAWAGTDYPHHLNIGWGLTSNWTFSNKRTINDYVGGSTGPSLTCFDPQGGLNTHLYVAFTGTDNQIWTGWFDGSVNLQDHRGTGQTSPYSPVLTVSQFNTLYLGWTGTDPGQHLNVTFSFYGTDWNNQVYILGDRSDGGPGLVDYRSPNYGDQLFMAWIGRDNNHTLNVGYFNSTTTLQNKSLLDWCCFSQTSFDVALTPYSGTLYLFFAGINNDFNDVYGSGTPNGWTYDGSQTYISTYGITGTTGPVPGDIFYHIWCAWMTPSLGFSYVAVGQFD